MSEMVDHPAHYGGDTPYEVIKVLEAWLGPEGFRAWLLGTIIKYLPRAGKKGSADEEIRDFEKVVWYTKYMIDFVRRTSVPAVPDSVLRCDVCRRTLLEGAGGVRPYFDGVLRFTCTKCRPIDTECPTWRKDESVSTG